MFCCKFCFEMPFQIHSVSSHFAHKHLPAQQASSSGLASALTLLQSYNTASHISVCEAITSRRARMTFSPCSISIALRDMLHAHACGAGDSSRASMSSAPHLSSTATRLSHSAIPCPPRRCACLRSRRLFTAQAYIISTSPTIGYSDTFYYWRGSHFPCRSMPRPRFCDDCDSSLASMLIPLSSIHGTNEFQALPTHARTRLFLFAIHMMQASPSHRWHHG